MGTPKTLAGLGLVVLVCAGTWLALAGGGGRESQPRRDALAAGAVEESAVAELVPAREAEEDARTDEPARAEGVSSASPPDATRGEATLDWLRRVLPERYGALGDAELLALEELDLRGAALTDADLWRLTAFPNLTRLGLRGTAITDAGLAALTRLPLTWLDLRGTGVSGDAFALLPAARLEALHLTDTKVTEADLARLPSLPSLVTLKLNFLALSDLAIEDLAAQPNLRHVELDGTQLTDEGLRRLLQLLPQLTRVEARDTRVSAEFVAELLHSHPGLEIVRE